MLNSAETVVLPSPMEPPMIERWAIRLASSGCVRSSRAMLVSGPTGAMPPARATPGGSGPSGRWPRRGAPGRRRRQRRPPDAALPVDRGRPHDLARSGPGGTLRDRDVAAPIGVQEAKGVLGAVADVGVAADGRDGQDVQLGPSHGQPDGEGVVQPGIAVDDERQRVPRASRPAPSEAPRAPGSRSVAATGPSPNAAPATVSPARTAGRWPLAR